MYYLIDYNSKLESIVLDDASIKLPCKYELGTFLLWVCSFWPIICQTLISDKGEALSNSLFNESIVPIGENHEYGVALHSLIDTCKKSGEEESRKIRREIDNLICYAELCSGDKKYFDLEKFQLFMAIQNESMPLFERKTLTRVPTQYYFHESEEIAEAFVEHKALQTLGIYIEPKYYLNAEEYNRQFVAIRAYHISTIRDLLYAAMQELIFAKKYIKVCQYCRKLYFVDKRFDTKYCSYENDDGRSCAKKKRAEQQKQREISSEYLRLSKSIRNMLYARKEYSKKHSHEYANKDEKVYEDFLVKDRKKRQQIKAKEITEKQYYDWLTQFYMGEKNTRREEIAARRKQKAMNKKKKSGNHLISRLHPFI